MDDLVERLRAEANGGVAKTTEHLLREAASLIERQAKERDRWQREAEHATFALNAQNARLASLRTEVERLQEQVRDKEAETDHWRGEAGKMHDMISRAELAEARLDLAMRVADALRDFVPIGWPMNEAEHSHTEERDDPNCFACVTNAIGNALAALDAGTTPAGEDARDVQSLHPAERDEQHGRDGSPSARTEAVE